MYNYGDYYQQRWLEDHLLSENTNIKDSCKHRLEKLLIELKELDASVKDCISQYE